MFLTILIVFISLIGLIFLHELGHFILAKKFGVKVEEFGIGLPPRIFGKKIGETIYSLNLLPLGAFVKIHGEMERIKDWRSFSSLPILKRTLIVLGGVLSFWLVAAILFTIIFNFGTYIPISDEENHHLIDPRIQIGAIFPDSPAEKAGLRAGDTIKKFSIFNFQFLINKVKEVQELTEKYKGKEITLTIERGKRIFDVKLVPRPSPPAGEGPMGVVLARTALKSYPWYLAPWQGMKTTFNLTSMVIQGYCQALFNFLSGQPSGIQPTGPVGIFYLFIQASQLGFIYFLQLIAIIAIYLAIFNLLPIPALDGGKLLFLGIEAIRKKPVSQKTEQNITNFFFGLLILLMILVTIKDIMRIF
jgi:regulator of sigma E protease